MKGLIFNIKKKTLVLGLLATFLLISCGSKKIVATNTGHFPPKLIFLNYSIKKTENGNKSVQFINKIITDGKLKRNSNKYIEVGVSGDLECHQLDKNSNIIQSVTIKNPLKRTVESLNDSLSFQVKQIELNNASFSLKLKLLPNTKYVSINEIIASKNGTNLLIKTKLY